jgi:CBS-domain-containing membrane protein
MLAKDIMSTPVISVGPETPVPEVAALLARHRISGVPVLDGGRLVGVVNEIDLMHRQEIGTDQVPALGPWWRRLFHVDQAPAQYVRSHATKVSDIMTRQVASVIESAPLPHIAALFDTRRIRRLPVLRDGKVVGIITRANLVDALAASTQGDHRPSERTDDVIRSELLTELARQHWWRPEWTAVTVIDGVVQFRGLIDTRDEIRAARVAAENVPGVRKVEDFRQRYGDLVGL